MTTLLAVDPGSTESAWVVVDVETCEPLAFGKCGNWELRAHLLTRGLLADPTLPEPERAYIEMIASYGMPVGAEVFETCVWVGRFIEAWMISWGAEPELVKRHPVKVHLCHSSQAKDSNIRQALVDRFAPGQPNYGKGTKANPGWFHGFHSDIWAAYAVAVYAADTMKEEDQDG